MLYCRQHEHPDDVIERFRQLFITGTGYREPEIKQALSRIIERPHAEQEFKFVLNYCCYILINYWHFQPQFHQTIPKLIALFQQIPPERPLDPRTRRLRALTSDFQKTDQYLALCRVFQFYTEPEQIQEDGLIQNLIPRYPFLFEDSLLTPDLKNEEQGETIRQWKRKAQQQVELDLARCYAHWQRGCGLASVPNPTLLSDTDLDAAFKGYTGHVDRYGSHRDAAQRFIQDSRIIPSFREFKEEFCEYLMRPLRLAAPRYITERFEQQLRQYLRGTAAEFDDRDHIDDFLKQRICKQLLQFLVVETCQNPVHFTFVDLISNVGHALTIGLLLRIVLSCCRIKAFFEQRFAILFNHYETNSKNDADIKWLVPAFEHVNIALATNFGKRFQMRSSPMGLIY
ncbi:MAG: hypothetical protein F6K19_00670 [Cyanothece sp. SIO1E1]|nr:hypothetical protein [Cyanothece sp. SIO1E1]